MTMIFPMIRRRSRALALCALTASGLLTAPAFATQAGATQTAATSPAGTQVASIGAGASAASSPAASSPAASAPGASEAAAAPAPAPYYVDFRARTAATYGHAFLWYGKSSERAVDVAGLHPATDSPVPYVLGHFMFVQSETGASYGDLDEQYLTANYRVYLSEEDAPKVFAYIQKLQKTTPFWNATTTNCTWFIGQVASFMGLDTPSHLLLPEDYVNELKKMNDSRNMASLAPGR
ncbi:hypothetical protein [Ancylobacter sp. FA202]|uniref:hypothetical protein n=1 Tax=Ancylobacter sp. FA202 TaxID=1111106 RepID=UPI00037EBEFD|nr:hypothetical protein [Ancylobacter sp. FA202]